MRTTKLLVCNAALLAMLLAPTAWAEDEAAAEANEAPIAGVPEAVETDEPALAAAPAAETAAMPAELDAMSEEGEASAPAASETAELPGDATAEAPVAEASAESALPDADEGAEVASAPEPASGPVLGEIGYDSEGRQGRIHVVSTGDTLWDISDAYLGTPWVWPSIWTDNRNIENPHVIHPRDHIWITDSEMRVVSPAEAEAMLAARPAAPEEFPAMDEPELTDAPVEIAAVSDAQQVRRVSVREWVGLISEDQLDAAASIVKRIPSHVMLAQIDQVYIGLGESDVEVGDEFEIIRDDEKVFDPETRRFLGYHVIVLGWLQVKEVYEETALAQIRMSMEDIGIGDKLIPRRPESLDVAIRQSPGDVEGAIAFFPRDRVVIGPLDFVYLNRGTLDGIEAGSPLEVVRGDEIVAESVRGEKVAVPERVVAKLLVVDAQPETSVALVAESEAVLEVGDNFRGAIE